MTSLSGRHYVSILIALSYAKEYIRNLMVIYLVVRRDWKDIGSQCISVAER